ncbi:ABC transporter ATP-binding protein [Companilactobacillus metriopterae]|uniref:ABC transporter ATP-binding protein n=1 Tax=Companilactobacillus metriopterae TaxID=1909267 RepID=UPI00100AF120|nr:ABC transporter ATP-binding protein [Companilactobacillus metriopterae]
MENVIEIKDLSYSKVTKKILEDVNLNIDSGKIVGLIGENGAGKTTLMRIMAGSLPNYTGDVILSSEKIIEMKKQKVSYSYTLEGFSKGTRIKTILDYYSTVYADFSNERYQEIAKFLDIDDSNKLSQLSKGMKEKFIIALTLARKVPIYLLDEPFSGIDSMSRKKIINSILGWVDDDSIVIISSHHIEEIANILDEIVLIKDEKIIAHESTEDIREKKNMSIEDYYESFYM